MIVVLMRIIESKLEIFVFPRWKLEIKQLLVLQIMLI